MLDRKTLRNSAFMLLGGLLTYIVVTLLHTAGPANNHEVIFADYAGSHGWGLVHLGQFAEMVILVSGLLGLSAALFSPQQLRAGAGAWMARLGAALAGIALALYAILQAVDGIALQQVVDAWASASGPEKAARFASAETVRWLEWGTRSYQCITLGLALTLLGAAVARSAPLPRFLGALMVLSGLAYLAQGWAVGSGGFTAGNTIAILAGYVLMLAWTTWLVVFALRTPLHVSPPETSSADKMPFASTDL